MMRKTGLGKTGTDGGNLKEIINDAELTGYVNRTLAFTRP
jgi:hypothetical protein